MKRCVCLLSRHDSYIYIYIYFEADMMFSSLFCLQASSLKDGACLGGLLETRLTHVHCINAQEELFNIILTL